MAGFLPRHSLPGYVKFKSSLSSLRRQPKDFSTANFILSKASKPATAAHTVILELRRPRRELHGAFEGSLGYRESLKCLNI